MGFLQQTQFRKRIQQSAQLNRGQVITEVDDTSRQALGDFPLYREPKKQQKT